MEVMCRRVGFIRKENLVDLRVQRVTLTEHTQNHVDHVKPILSSPTMWRMVNHGQIMVNVLRYRRNAADLII